MISVIAFSKLPCELEGNSRRERMEEKRERNKEKEYVYIYIKLENEWSRKILRYQLQESRFCAR